MMEEPKTLKRSIFSNSPAKIKRNALNSMEIANNLVANAKYDEAISTFQTAVASAKSLTNPSDSHVLVNSSLALTEIYFIQCDFESAQAVLNDLTNFAADRISPGSLESVEIEIAQGRCLHYKASNSEAENCYAQVDSRFVQSMFPFKTIYICRLWTF